MRAKHLLLAWGTYWVGTGLAILAPAIRTAWRLTHLPDNHASIGLSFNNADFHLTMSELGKTMWEGSASLGAIALWAAGPPLILWLGWLLTRGRRQPTTALSDGVDRGDTLGGSGTPRALNAGRFSDVDLRARQAEKAPVRRERGD
jgi:hypothetical protein